METQTNPLRIPLITGLAIGAVFGAALLLVRSEQQAALADQAALQHDALDKMGHQIGMLESRLATLETAPRVDTAAMDGMRADITALQTESTQVTAQLGALEKKATTPVAAPAPATATLTPAQASPVLVQALDAAFANGAPYQEPLDAWAKAHPGMEAKTTALRKSAATGMPTDAALHEQFRTLVQQVNMPDTPTDESPTIGHINRYFAGLISIKKASDPSVAYRSLQGLDLSAPLETLAARVDSLPGPSRVPFTAWYETVRARAAATAELSALPALDHTP